MTPRTREERETIIRFDETDEPAHLWTASVIQRRRWERLGLLVETFGGGWRARVDKRRVTVRRERPKGSGNPAFYGRRTTESSRSGPECPAPGSAAEPPSQVDSMGCRPQRDP